MQLDRTRRRVCVDGHVVDVPRREYDLLRYLMDRPAQTVTRSQLLQEVWGYANGSGATLSVHMRQLRRRTETDPSRPRHLLTVRGVGYRFEP